MIGSKDTQRSLLKGSQSRTWATIIEAITADGRVLSPGVIFKGKELQAQWFTDEIRRICPNWYAIASPNGWTSDHIGHSWLEDVYLPQTTPEDPSDARLIILDGHGSHATVSEAITKSELRTDVYRMSG